MADLRAASVTRRALNQLGEGSERFSDLLLEVRGPKIVEQFLPETDQWVRVAHIALVARTAQSATNLNGHPNLYGGPVQRRIQQRMAELATRELGVDRIRLQVLPPFELEAADFGPSQNKRVDYVPLEDAIAAGLISSSSTLARTCREWGLKSILVRGRQVIGPSPAIAKALVYLAPALQADDPVLDPFAGTFLTTSVLARSRPDLEANAFDRLGEGGQPTGFDAFAFASQRRYELVVVDPLYEDVLSYLRDRLPLLEFKFALIQSGESSDLSWNNSAERLLLKMGSVRRLPAFGKCVFLLRTD